MDLLNALVTLLNFVVIPATAYGAQLALGALGGCMIPIQTMPDVMQQVSRFIPHSWALLGLQSLIRDGGGIDSVATNLAVLVGFGVVLMTLAVWRFRKAIAG